jgi:hypothetical protein
MLGPGQEPKLWTGPVTVNTGRVRLR